MKSHQSRAIMSTTMAATEDLFTTTTFEFEDGDLNHTGVTSDAVHHLEESQSVSLFYSVLSAIFVLGIFGNSLLLTIFILQKSMRTVPNTYIFNLALADLLVIVSCSVAPLLQKQDSLSTLPLLCKSFQLLLGSCNGVISFTLMALSVERYYAIARPLHKRVSSKKMTVVVALLTWVVCISYSVLRMVLLNREGGFVCVLMYDPISYSHVYALIDAFALYLTPLIIITIFYILLAKNLYFSGSFMMKANSLNSSIPRHVKVRKRIALTVLILVFMFAVFYFPFNFFSVMFYLRKGYVIKGRFDRIIFCVGCVHGCLNPLILYTLSESFRGHINNYLYFNIFKPGVAVKNEHQDCRCQCRAPDCPCPECRAPDCPCPECSRKTTSLKMVSSTI